MVEKLKKENKLLRERLEYFTDKYGIPDSFEDFNLVKEEIKEVKVDASQPNNLIDIQTSKTNHEIYKKLVDESIRDLLKIQLSELLELAASQNKQSVMVFNTLQKLKDQLKDK